MSALDAACTYIGRSWAPVPVPYRKKRAILDEWPELRIGLGEAPRYFNGAPQNVGVILGLASGGLVDVDLDCSQAQRVAREALPPTGSAFGRESKPGSHLLYTSATVDPETGEVRPERCATTQFRDPTDNAMLVELRGDGGAQTVFPGSTHESGEPVEWQVDGDAAPIREELLRGAVAELAAVALFAKHWPAGKRRDAEGNEAAGGRHDANLKLAGWLTRRGWEKERIGRFLALVSAAAGAEPDRKKRRAIAADAAARVANDGKLYGWPAVVELFGQKVVDRAAEWLGIRRVEHADAEPGETTEATDAAWPAPLAPEAYHGLAGEVVRAIEPHTEADPAALLLQFLAAFGNAYGCGSYARVEGDRHPPRLFTVQVGRTAKGRKGTSWGRVREVLELADPEWLEQRVASGLSSGEGVIHEVRDPVTNVETDKKTGEQKEVCVDAGVGDKRLLVMESEFAKALRAMERQGNTLSAVLRDAWDQGKLRLLVKTSPTRATGAHVSVIGHITADELRRYLDRTEAANGLANRFLFVCVQRSKLLPRGGDRVDWADIGNRLRLALVKGRNLGEVQRTEAAWKIWEAVYPALSADRPGLLGAVLGRAEAQVLRLALVYALLDGQAFIDEPHMLAALACWDYCEASARHIFGGTLGDPTADEIVRLIRGSAVGITRTEISAHFGRHRSSEEIGRALALLARENLATKTVEGTGGRPVERWKSRL